MMGNGHAARGAVEESNAEVSSMHFTCALMDGRLRKRISEARVMLPSRATVTNVRSWFIFICLADELCSELDDATDQAAR